MTPTSRRTAVVTGASSGIGEATARLLACDHRVALVARSKDKLDQLAEELGDGADPFACDLSDAHAVEELVPRIVEHLGSIDVLVNNAGSAPERLLTTNSFAKSVEQFRAQLDANLMPSFFMLYAFGAHITRPGGRVINVGSIAAQNGGSRPGSAGYAAAKAAVHGLTIGASRELAPEGITVNTVAPGFTTPTSFTSGWADDVVQRLIDGTPAGRAATPDDIAHTIAYLASPEAGMVTAQLIGVNGGAMPSR